MNNKKISAIIPVLLGVLVAFIIIFAIKYFIIDNREIGIVINEADTGNIGNTGNGSNSQNSGQDNNSNQVSMVFGGDYLLSNEMLNKYNKDGGNLENIMASSLQKEFQNADIAMVNNEFPYSTRGTQAENKQYTFRADPSNVNILKEMGVDIVSLANNHALDFGVDALVDSMDTLKGASILYGGAGNNLDEAKEIKYIERKNKKIAFLCATRVIPVTDWNATNDRPGLLTTYDPTNLVEMIQEAKNNADVSIVFVHWGVERAEMPEDYQRELAMKYIDAGADMVIGAHSHCLQGMEVYNGKLITYSLGNFIFNGRYNKTMALKATVEEDNSIKAQFIPCESSSYQTYISEGDKAKEIMDYYKSISFDINMDEEGYIQIN